jgi:hypothetical protein
MPEKEANGLKWLHLILTLLMATAGAVAWIETRVGGEATIRHNEDVRIEQKIDRNQQRIEDKLDDIQNYLMERD